MPRSLAELALAHARRRSSSLSGRDAEAISRRALVAASATTRMLLSEYVKFLPPSAALTAQRVIDRRDGPSRSPTNRRRSAIADRSKLRPRPWSLARSSISSLFYVNTALSWCWLWLLLGPRRWAMEGLEAARPPCRSGC